MSVNTISHHTALVYIMVVVAAADGVISDKELKTMGDLSKYLPAFRDFDHSRVLATAQDCGAILQEPEGLDAVIGLAKAGAARAFARDRLLAGAGSRTRRQPHHAGRDPSNRSDPAGARSRQAGCLGTRTRRARAIPGRMKRLLLLRHGKAEERPPTTRSGALIARGKTDSARVGRFLRDDALYP